MIEHGVTLQPHWVEQGWCSKRLGWNRGGSMEQGVVFQPPEWNRCCVASPMGWNRGGVMEHWVVFQPPGMKKLAFLARGVEHGAA